MQSHPKSEPRRARGDQGVTFIEMLITIVLMTAVIASAAAAFSLTAKSAVSVNDRLKKSNDAQIITSFLTGDAASAGGYDQQNNPVDASIASPGVYVGISITDGFCDDAGSVLRLEWVERAIGTAPVRVAANYAVANGQLTRKSCRKSPASPGGPSTTETKAVLGRYIDSATVTCIQSCTTGRVSPTPVIVTLNVVAAVSPAPGSTTYRYSVSGFLRAGGNATFANSDVVPLIALGVPTNTAAADCPTTPRASGLAMAATAGSDPWTPKLTVFGISVINSNATNPACGPAVNLAGPSTAYGALNTLLLNPGMCTGCATGQTIPITEPIPDPYATVTPPTSRSCSGTGNPAPTTNNNLITFNPGVYKDVLQLAGGIDSQFVFGSSGDGIFYFCKGITLCSGVRFDAGQNGVLLYFAPNGQAANSMRQGSGSSCSGYQDFGMHLKGRPEWNNIVIWQGGASPAGQPSVRDVQIPSGENNLPAGLNSNIDGIVYAPQSQVEFYLPTNANSVGGWPATPIEGTVLGVVARNVVIDRVTRMRIGPGPQTTTAMTASPNPANVGQPVTLVARVQAVAPATGTPTGSVEFFDETADLGNAPLVNGVATLTVRSIRGGARPLTAVYSGDTLFASSVSPTLNQINNTVGSTTTLTSNPNPSGANQTTRLVATVAGPGPFATGNVAFYEGQTLLGVGPLAAAQAYLDIAFGAIGSHTLQAVFAGDVSYQGSASALYNHVVLESAVVTLTATPNPANVTRDVTLTATVTSQTPGLVTPTGTVTFMDGATQLGGGPAIINGLGTATIPVTFATSGVHNLTAIYSGDSIFAVATSSQVPVTANKVGSNTTLTSSPNSPALVGQAVTFTATVTSQLTDVTPYPTPTGTVTFRDGATTLGTSNLNNAGLATFTTSTLSSTSHTISAVYNANATYNTSTSANQTYVINGVAVTVTLTKNDNNITLGEQVDFVVSVDRTGGGTDPTSGSVTLYDNGVQIGFDNNIGSNHTSNFNSLTFGIGAHSIVAVYSGAVSNGVTYAPGQSTPAMTFTVSGYTTDLQLVTSKNPAGFGEAITFTATINETSPGTPTGTITFLDNGVVIGTANLNGSAVATFTTSSLTISTHPITATYPATGNFASDTSNTVSQVIRRLVAVTMTSDRNNPAGAGSTVIFTATVARTEGTGTPSGQVSFYVDGVVASTRTLVNGSITYSTAALSPGAHTIYAGYLGDNTFAPGISTTLGQSVGQYTPNVALTLSAGTNPSVWGQSITFRAAATGAGPTPSGNVTLYSNCGPSQISRGTANLNGSGIATFTTSSLPLGTSAMCVVYAGDTNYLGQQSNTMSQTVNQSGTAVTLTLAGGGSTSAVGQSVTFLADVNPTGNGSGIPTGTVTFTDNGVTVPGTFNVNGAGVASYVVTYNVTASHTITAQYNGNANFAASAIATFTLTMPPRGLTITANPNAGSGSNGQPSNADTVVFTFDQAITPTSVIANLTNAAPQNVRVRFCRNSGQETVLTVFTTTGGTPNCNSTTTVTLGTVDLGDTNTRYISSGNTVILTGTLSVNAANTQITLTITQTPSNSTFGTNTGNTTLTWTTNNGVTSPTGNVVAASVTESPAKRNF